MKKYRFLAVESAKNLIDHEVTLIRKVSHLVNMLYSLSMGGGITSHEIDYLILQGGG